MDCMKEGSGMSVRLAREQTGMAMVAVLLIIVVLIAVGGFMAMGVNRNTELGAGFQKNVAGLHAAGGGVELGGTPGVTAEQNYGLAGDCNRRTPVVGGRGGTGHPSGA